MCVCMIRGIAGEKGCGTYPEIHLEVPGASEFAIADLERHGHLVVFVEDLVEAFARVGAHLDVVAPRCGGEEGEERAEEDEGEAEHGGF